MNTSPATSGAPISEALAAKFAEKFNLFFEELQFETANEIFAIDSLPPLVSDHALENIKAHVAGFYEAAPDFIQIANQNLIAKDRLVLRVAYVGTQTGELFGMPPTGQQVAMNGLGIFRFNDDGYAIENWVVIDVAGTVAQIGAYPPASS